MRKYYIILLIGVLFSNCESILDVEITDSIDGNEMVITNLNRAELGMTGLYDELQSGLSFTMTLSDLQTDDIVYKGFSPSAALIDANKVPADYFFLNLMWYSFYGDIKQANILCEDLPMAKDIPTETSNRMQGEALFLRAFAYFNLVNNWGPVPLLITAVRTSEDIENMANDSVDKIFTQIEADLLEADTKLGDYAEQGRASSMAAKALLSRVYLYQEKWQQAYDYANAVIESGQYSLLENYEEIFDHNNPYSSESIFEIDFDEEQSNALSFWYYPTDLGGRYLYGVSDDLVNAFDTLDKRFDASIGLSDASGYYVKKYNEIANSSDNIIVIRLAEMYLTRAEALLNGASPNGADTRLEDFNKTYTRAGLGPHPGPVTTDDILNERRFEFAFEMHRWYDLTRTGEAINVLENVISTNQYLWPIPQAEIDVNPFIEQNQGY